MIGYCGGLCYLQCFGDYVLVYVYLCYDVVLDEDILVEVLILLIVEIQIVLENVVVSVSGDSKEDFKFCLWIGIVVIYVDWNWELCYVVQVCCINQLCVIVVDMESVMIVVNGLCMCVFYGMLFCVFDKLLYGELKLLGVVNFFYQCFVSEYLVVGIEIIEIFKCDEVLVLYLCKLCSFDELLFCQCYEVLYVFLVVVCGI